MIAVVEDEKELCESLKLLLTDKGYEIVTAGSCGEADKFIGNPQIDMFLLDVKLPDGSGFDICRKIRKSSEVPVIFLTSCDNEEEIVMGLDIGADDYITKPFNPLELIARVNSQIRRYTSLGSIAEESNKKIYKSGDLIINDETKQVEVEGREVKLTPTEYNILKFLTKNKGIVYSIEQIYENVWEEQCFGAENIIAVHIRHIREKMEINPKEPKYLKVIWGIGYKIEKM